MTERRGRGTGSLAAVAVVLAVVLPLAAAFAAPPRVKVIAPRDGSSMSAGATIVIGTTSAPPGTPVDVEVNGRTSGTGVVAQGGGFRVPVYLFVGKNAVRVEIGGAALALTIPAFHEGSYKYHPEVDKCEACHGDAAKGYAVSGARDAICYRCHERKDVGKVIHGPLGGGDCTACHDPHGSGNRALTVAGPDSLCATCHDHKSSEMHLKKSRGRPCTECHDPHSANKAFLQK